jgi:hypothetical protein
MFVVFQRLREGIHFLGVLGRIAVGKHATIALIIEGASHDKPLDFLKAPSYPGFSRKPLLLEAGKA